jgi:hypothetical protein
LVIKANIVPLAIVIASGRWRAQIHLHDTAKSFSASHDLLPLREVVTESTAAVDPHSIGSRFFYIGLENVESVTGEPIAVAKVDAGAVRSRSKTFKNGQILYGRLRPYLRKALLVEPPYHTGLCSTEFIVLEPNESMILPILLRELLVSPQVTEGLTRMQSGAALPRVSSRDLLAIKVPIPPLATQRVIAAQLQRIREQRRDLRAKLESLVVEAEKILNNVY